MSDAPPWLRALLAQAAAGEQPSLLEIGSGDGTLLEQAASAGVEPFGIDPAGSASRCPDAFVVTRTADLLPHRFGAIVLSTPVDGLTLRDLLYQLAAKDAFGRDTSLVVQDRFGLSLDLVTDDLRALRFGVIERQDDSDGSRLLAQGSDFGAFMQERFVPGTWSELAAYEHLPRYAFAATLFAGARVLDFGCGSGYGTAALAQTARHVVGVDIDEGALAFARAHHGAANLRFARDALFGGTLSPGSFDAIVCFEVIEHLTSSDQRVLLGSLRRLLAPGGTLLVSTPNPAITALYGENPFHLHEMGRDEFGALLGDHFPHVSLLEQSIEAAVVIRPMNAGPTLEDRSGIAAFDGSSAPAIFLALCSEHVVDPVPAVIFRDRSRNFAETRTAALRTESEYLLLRYYRAKLERQLAAESAATAAARAEAAAAASAAAAAQQAGGLLEESHTATRAAADRLGSALEAERADAARAASLARSELARLNRLRRSEQRRARDERAALQAKADALSAAHAELSELAADRQRQAIAASSRLLLTQSRLLAIESSTLWRAVRAATPFLAAARPALRPLARTGYRLLRAAVPRRAAVTVEGPAHAVENAVLPAGPSADPTPVPAPPTPSPPASPARLDPRIARETSLQPVWDGASGRYRLVPEPGWSAQEAPAHLRPYVVVPVTPIGPGTVRPTILHVIPNVHIGGSTQLVIDLVEHLSSAFHHEVLTSSLWPGGDHEGLIVHHVPTASAADMEAVMLRVDPDLVHVHYWGLSDDPWYHAACEAIRGHGAPTVQNVNTPVVPLVDDVFSHYVFVSDYVRQTFGDSVVGQRPTSVIHPGIDLARFDGGTPAPDRTDAVGMVYRLEDDKLNAESIEVFIEIVRRRPRTMVFIIGGGRFLLPFIDRTIEAGVRENFRFTGYVPYETLPSWYDRFAVFVAPVWKESFGQVSPFAMTKRAAVAGYAIGALAEILGSDETLADTPAAVAEIVVRLLDDPARLQSTGVHNRERALSMFDVMQMVGQYKSLYEQLLGA